jgi:GNAT superfamily N-acetyltransferase
MEMGNDVRIRPATVADSAFIAWVQLAAARSHLAKGYYDLAFPGPEAERLSLIERLCRTKTRSFCHWQGFLVAEVNGKPASALSGYTPRKVGIEGFLEALQEVLGAAGWSARDMQAMSDRTDPFLTCIPDTPDDAWVVEWVATLPEFRARGLIRSLLHAILDKGRAEGHRLAQIAVLIGNTPAQHAYEGVGFKVKDEKRHADFERALGCPGVRRLMRDL